MTLRLLRTIFLLLLCVSTGCASHPNGADWKTLNCQAESLYRKGQYGRGLEVGTKALDVAEIYVTQHNFSQAEPLFVRSIAINEEDLGPNHPEVVATLNSLAEVYIKTDRAAEARKIEDRLRAIESHKPRCPCEICRMTLACGC